MYIKNQRILQLIMNVSLISSILFGTSSWADNNQTYVVLYNQHAVPANAASIIAQNNGTLVYSYDQIGVVIAKSNSDFFASGLSVE